MLWRFEQIRNRRGENGIYRTNRDFTSESAVYTSEWGVKLHVRTCSRDATYTQNIAIQLDGDRASSASERWPSIWPRCWYAQCSPCVGTYTQPPERSRRNVVIVSVPPDILDYPTSTDMVVREGSNVTLRCAATGTPEPTVTWRREAGGTISSSNWHEGTYLCAIAITICFIGRQLGIFCHTSVVGLPSRVEGFSLARSLLQPYFVSRISNVIRSCLCGEVFFSSALK